MEYNDFKIAPLEKMAEMKNEFEKKRDVFALSNTEKTESLSHRKRENLECEILQKLELSNQFLKNFLTLSRDPYQINSIKRLCFENDRFKKKCVMNFKSGKIETLNIENERRLAKLLLLLYRNEIDLVKLLLLWNLLNLNTAQTDEELVENRLEFLEDELELLEFASGRNFN